MINPLPLGSNAVRKQKKIEDLFGSVILQFQKSHPSGNLKFNDLDILQSLKLRKLVGKSFQFLLRYISLYVGLLGVKNVFV